MTEKFDGYPVCIKENECAGDQEGDEAAIIDVMIDEIQNRVRSFSNEGSDQDRVENSNKQSGSNGDKGVSDDLGHALVF